MPLAVVATERASRKLVAFTRGDTGLAVRASSSVPVILASPFIEQKAYVDAAVANPLPTLSFSLRSPSSANDPWPRVRQLHLRLT